MLSISMYLNILKPVYIISDIKLQCSSGVDLIFSFCRGVCVHSSSYCVTEVGNALDMSQVHHRHTKDETTVHTEHAWF